jgi:hypothetical protein
LSGQTGADCSVVAVFQIVRTLPEYDVRELVAAYWSGCVVSEGMQQNARLRSYQNLNWYLHNRDVEPRRAA